jgi:methyl-accepting chemotaxis protein
MVDRTVALAADYQAKLKAHSDSQLTWAIALLIGLAGAALAFVAAACVVLLRKVVGPLTEVVGATTVLARGGTAVVPHQTRKDELGEMAGAVELFRVAAEERAECDARAVADQQMVTASLGQSLSALSAGDLTRFIRDDYPDGYVVLKTNYNEALGSLREMIQMVSESASEISSGSSEIAKASEDLARRTESNAASLEQTNAALVQVEDRIKTTSVASIKTVARADQAITTVQSGRSTADQAVLAMDRVSDSAKGIDSVIEGLDKIAFQTRVLAMNAAVEAGRAGEAGRGFAVVADLVSALAMRAEEEAKRARDQLTVTQTEIVTAVHAVKKVDGALADIAGDVDEVHRLLDSMASDNQAQALAITEITVAVGTMDKSTQQNAAMVEETTAATRNLSTEVKSLAERAAIFKFERRNRNVTVTEDRRTARAPAVVAPSVLSIRTTSVRPRAGRFAASTAAATADWAEF